MPPTFRSPISATCFNIWQVLTHPMMKGISCPVVLISLMSWTWFHPSVSSIDRMNHKMLRKTMAFHVTLR